MTYEDVLSALADPTRRAILEALRHGPRSVSEIAEEMPVSRPAVSQHLAILRDANLVSEERDGTRRLYAASGKGLEMLRRYLEKYWGEALASFASEATRTTKRKRRT